MLIVGLAGPLLISLLLYSGGEPDAQTSFSTEDAKASQLTELEAPAFATEQDAAVPISPPVPAVVAPPGGGARPDAGYYDHPSRPYGVAGFLLFNSILAVSAQDVQSATDKILQVTQVDEETAREFLEYIQGAKDDLDRFERQRTVELCAQRDAIRTIPQLAAAFDVTDVAVESRRARLTRGSESILGEVGMRNFEMYIASKDRGKRATVRDNTAALMALNRSPEQVLEIYCSQR